MKYLILGGTGTLGRALTAQLLKQDDTESIVCFSRDELKQKDLASEVKDPRLSFMLGDIRDPVSLWAATRMRDLDTVFHVAALKHIDTLEMNPEECVKTNIIGTTHVADCAIAARVKHVVFSSTDKAVEPINIYGMSKGISEKILLNRNRLQSVTKFSVFRWGNVIGSRGSVVHSFAKSIKRDHMAYVTDMAMTRFWIRIEDAVAFMLREYPHADGVMVPDMKSAPITDVVSAVASLVGVSVVNCDVIGHRPGEKVHESIFPGKSSQDGPYYSVAELKELIGPVL